MIARARSILGQLSPAIFVRIFSPTDPELGLLGEEVAARYLRARGLTIVGRRVKNPLGEIDVLAREGGTIVCVEVKSGRVTAPPRPKGEARQLGMRWRPGLRVDHARLERLHRCARSLARDARVDIVEALLDTRASRWVVLHHIDARRPIEFRPQ